MAQYQVTHTCGHSETVQLYGPSKERERRLTWLRSQSCLDCKRASHEGEARESRILSQMEGLPRLDGTDRQIAWAETIRRDKLTETAAMLAQLRADPQAQEEPSQMLAIDAAERALRAQRSASWWIDHRTDSGRYLIRSLLRG